ncbi:DUF2397 family protein, partial [Actinokineospora sp. PR83]|uniref:DUF2397 family protein n=1 Tax=Actinokineospora sp. PR83 TaxID=2884908 RepID=UPI001F46DECF
ITEQGLLAAARAADERREAAAAELAAAAAHADGIDSAVLSAPALRALCELLTLAMAQREGAADPGSATDQVRGLTLRLTPARGRTTNIRSESGTLTLRDTVVDIARVQTARAARDAR